MKKTLGILCALLLAGGSYAQSQLPNTLSKIDKIYGLSKYWNEVNFNFAYLNKVDKNQWEENYKELLAKVQSTKNDYDYYRLLQQFSASLKDGHTSIFLPKSLTKFILNGEFGDYKLVITTIDGNMVITQVNYSKRKEIPIGTVITAINGQQTADYLAEKVLPYISYSTDKSREALAATQILNSPIGTEYQLQLKKPNGKLLRKTFRISPAKETKLYPEMSSKAFEFKKLNRNLVYIAINSFENAAVVTEFKNKLPAIRKADGLIIDLRKNMGGNSGFAYTILKHLTHDRELVINRTQVLDYNPLFEFYGVQYNIQAKDTAQGSPENRKLLQRAYLTARDSYFYEIPFNTHDNQINKSERVVLPTVLLTGPLTASSSEDFIVATDNQQHITTIGQPTAGTTGMAMGFQLPGGGWARICIKKERFPDGREYVGYGIQPKVQVKTTVQDFIQQKDPVLRTAIAYLLKK